MINRASFVGAFLPYLLTCSGYFVILCSGYYGSVIRKSGDLFRKLGKVTWVQ